MNSNNLKVQASSVTFYLFIYLRNTFPSKQFGGKLTVLLDSILTGMAPSHFKVTFPKVALVTSHSYSNGLVTIQYHDSQQYLGGEMVQLELLGMNNPVGSSKQAIQVEVKSYSTEYLIDSSLFSLTYKASTLGSLQVTMVRDNIYSNNATAVTIGITTQNMIPKGGDIHL